MLSIKIQKMKENWGKKFKIFNLFIFLGEKDPGSGSRILNPDPDPDPDLH